MSKVKKSQPQPPFRLNDLVRISSFIVQYQRYDIRTTEHELEYFEKEGLLYPALRIDRGIVKNR